MCAIFFENPDETKTPKNNKKKGGKQLQKRKNKPKTWIKAFNKSRGAEYGGDFVQLHGD